MGLGLQGMKAVLASPSRPFPCGITFPGGTSFIVGDGVTHHKKY